MTVPRSLAASAASVCGPSRARNEDFAVIGDRRVRDGHAATVWDVSTARRPFVAAVLDGLGGHQGGDRASALVGDRLVRTLNRWSLELTVEECTEGLIDTLADAHRELERIGARHAEVEGMGTTCTALLVTQAAFVLAHVGDTRCYRRRDDTWKQLTVDHAVLVPAAGGAFAAQLTHAVGAGVPDLPAQLVADLSEKCFPGDVYVLLTDGVVNATTSDTALEHALDAGDALAILEAALAHGGPDNATAVRLEILA